MVAGVAVSVITLVAAWLSTTLSDVEGASALGAVVVFIAVIGALLITAAVAVKHRYVKRVRLSRFAEANNLTYIHEDTKRRHAGMIFNVGRNTKLTDVLRSADGAEVDFETGHYQYTVGSGRSQRTYYWRYVWIGLDRHLPHLVLDGMRNNHGIFNIRISNLPTAPQKQQRVSLEGDFDKYFALYAPEGYERDARYVFTPDLMVLMIDKAHDFDAEVVDTGIYFYQKENRAVHAATPEPRFFERVHKIVHVLGVKMNRRTDYYADERVGDRAQDVVAERGRRLRRRVPLRVLVTIGIIAFIALMMIYSFITNNHTL